MKVGDIIQFKATGVIGIIINIWQVNAEFTDVKVFHNVPNIQNPTGFSLAHLEEVAAIVSS